MSKDSLRHKLIKSYSTISPDSSLILNYVLKEEEFKPKTDFFLKMVGKLGIPCEILPSVNREITKKFIFAAEEYVKIVRSCKSWLSKLVKSIKDLETNIECTMYLEEAFDGVITQIEKKHFPHYRDKIDAIRRARIVETSIMLEFFEALEKSEKIDLGSFLDKLENEFGKKYLEFFDTMSEFMKEIDAKMIKGHELLPTTDTLNDIFRKKCCIINQNDVILLCQAVSRMYGENRWYSVITTDYGDLIKNKLEIEKHTLLVASDPLYCLYHLDKKIDLALKPRDAAGKLRIPFATFIIFPQPIGII